MMYAFVALNPSWSWLLRRRLGEIVTATAKEELTVRRVLEAPGGVLRRWRTIEVLVECRQCNEPLSASDLSGLRRRESD